VYRLPGKKRPSKTPFLFSSVLISPDLLTQLSPFLAQHSYFCTLHHGWSREYVRHCNVYDIPCARSDGTPILCQTRHENWLLMGRRDADTCNGMHTILSSLFDCNNNAQLLTIALAICMFVGTADGRPGQHVKTRHKHPIWSNRIKVFEQVRAVLPGAYRRLTRNPDRICRLSDQCSPLGFTKQAVLLFYRRIFPGRTLNILLWTMICLTCIWVVGFFFSQLLQCIPMSLNWSSFGNLPDHCINVDRMILAEAWSDVVTNVIILMLPIPSVSLSISRRFLILN